MKPRSFEIQAAILDAVIDHPHDLASHIAGQFGITRPAVLRHVNALIGSGFLAATGTTRRTYALGSNRERIRVYPLAGLDEWLVWSRDFAPLVAGIPGNVEDIAHRGFTEMLNNAIDHSAGKQVRVGLRLRDKQLEMMISDDGEGIFTRITRLLGLADERLALLELSKGKLTTDPANHTGEGIFFSSRMFDQFTIRSGKLAYFHDIDLQFDWLHEIPLPKHGTRVSMSISTESTRTAKAIYDEYNAGPGEFNFNKTVVPLRLARFGNENLVSRSQAKRVTARFESFRVVVLDFEGVPDIGQGFADELFRVFAKAHPEIELVPLHCTAGVQQMIGRAIAAAQV
jgi:anti-sigma regulatory factor (Ser/Thr protein kinase)